MEVSFSAGFSMPCTVSCSQRVMAMLSDQMRQASLVSSDFMYSTCPGPAGERMMRQKLALVVSGAPSVGLMRMNGFSPVRITLFGSAMLMWVCPSRCVTAIG
jgi:hypothetical protein